jgi:hypothetical protein
MQWLLQRSYIYRENKALKIETVIHLFPKFTRMQETCLTHACLPIFCARWGRTYNLAWVWVGTPAWTRSQEWSARASSNYLKARASNIPTIYIYIYIYI